MPIRAEDRARYPAEWPLISLWVRVCAGWRCEWCPAVQGEPHPVTGSRVVLTVAHLGLPPKLPLLLHVAGDAMTDEVVQMVGLIMPINTEQSKCDFVMHNRAAAEFSRGAPARGAGFFISIPSSPPSGTPTGSIVFGANAAAPIWISLTTWRLLGKPSEPTWVGAKSAAVAEMKPTHRISASAFFANSESKAAFRSADAFVATGRRTSFSAIRSLLRCEWEPNAAYDACCIEGSSSWSSHGSLYHMDEYPENCNPNNLRALCQKCHLGYDREHHQRTRRRTLIAAMGTADLMEKLT